MVHHIFIAALLYLPIASVWMCLRLRQRVFVCVCISFAPVIYMWKLKRHCAQQIKFQTTACISNRRNLVVCIKNRATKILRNDFFFSYLFFVTWRPPSTQKLCIVLLGPAFSLFLYTKHTRTWVVCVPVVASVCATKVVGSRNERTHSRKIVCCYWRGSCNSIEFRHEAHRTVLFFFLFRFLLINSTHTRKDHKNSGWT